MWSQPATGTGLSQYELQRARNIQRNEQMLTRLGLQPGQANWPAPDTGRQPERKKARAELEHGSSSASRAAESSGGGAQTRGQLKKSALGQLSKTGNKLNDATLQAGSRAEAANLYAAGPQGCESPAAHMQNKELKIQAISMGKDVFDSLRECFAVDDETLEAIASRLGVEPTTLLGINQPRYPGLTEHSKLMAGTSIVYPVKSQAQSNDTGSLQRHKAGIVLMVKGDGFALFKTKQEVEDYARNAGAKVMKKLSKDVTHMVVPNGSTNGLQDEGGVIVVDESWLHPMRKGCWSKREDQILTQAVQAHGPHDWSQIAGYLPGRIGKQCRARWQNTLDPSVRNDPFTEEETQILQEAHKKFGNQWSKVAALLPGRTQSAVRSQWVNAVAREARSRQRVIQETNISLPTVESLAGLKQKWRDRRESVVGLCNAREDIKQQQGAAGPQEEKVETGSILASTIPKGKKRSAPCHEDMYNRKDKSLSLLCENTSSSVSISAASPAPVPPSARTSD